MVCFSPTRAPGGQPMLSLAFRNLGRLTATVWLFGAATGCGDAPTIPCVGSACGSVGDGDKNGDGDDDSSGSAKARMPCDVKAIVYEHCTECHDDPPVGTYMPVLTRDHFLAKSSTDPDRKYYELALERINAKKDPMPPVTSSTLTADEKETL